MEIAERAIAVEFDGGDLAVIEPNRDQEVLAGPDHLIDIDRSRSLGVNPRPRPAHRPPRQAEDERVAPLDRLPYHSPPVVPGVELLIPPDIEAGGGQLVSQPRGLLMILTAIRQENVRQHRLILGHRTPPDFGPDRRTQPVLDVTMPLL